MHKPIIDPWGSTLIENYTNLIKEFKLEPFDNSTLKLFPKPNYLMRRFITFSGIGLKRIALAIKKKEKFYTLTGIMPSAEKLHLGTKHVIENVKYFQQFKSETYLLVADLEAAATRDVTLEEARERALNFHIPAYIALGLDPKKTTFYFQSENEDVKNLAYIFSKKITLNEFRSTYGNIDPGRILSSLAQSGDILFPQLKEKMPGIIPVGIDQLPHILLSRDIVKRTKSRFNFELPSGIFHKFTPSLDGSFKMSKSKPESCIELPEDINLVCKKLRKAVSGGRDTLAEHRKLGAIVEKDMVFEILKQHLITDDKKLNKIYNDYKSGKLTTTELKDIACLEMEKFMNDFTKKLEIARKKVDKLNFIR